MGSLYLQKRVEELRPNLHVPWRRLKRLPITPEVFGHTHFGYDLSVDGVRYVQAPLSMSSERLARGTTVALGDFPDGLPPQPFMVWHSRSGWAAKSSGAWSAYVERYGRRPDVTWLIPSYAPRKLRAMGRGLSPGGGHAAARARRQGAAQGGLDPWPGARVALRPQGATAP